MSDNLYLFANNNSGQAEHNGSYRLYDMKIEGDSEGVESGVNYADYLIYSQGRVMFKTNITYKTDTTVEYALKEDLMELDKNNNKFDGLNAIFQTCRSDGKYIENNILIQNGNQALELENGITILTPNEQGVYSYTFTKNIDSTRALVLGCSNTNWTGIRAIEYMKFYQLGEMVAYLRPAFDTEGNPCIYDDVSKTYLYNQGTGTFSCKKILREFQPVLDSNNVPCLLDKIKNKFYYSKSGEVFKTKEKPKYKKLKYIQGNGSFNIDTNISLNPQSKIEHTFQEMKSSLNISYLKVGDGSKFKFYSEGTINNYAMTYNGEYVYCRLFDKLRNKSILLIDKNKIYINGELKSQGNETTSTINYNGFLSIKGNASTRLYSSKVWNENNELVLDLIPVLDQDNVPCMYDKVTDTFFYNQGTGEFSYGIEELDASDENYIPIEYIESTGTQYIDTEVVPTSNTDIEMTCRVCDYNETPTLTNSYIMNGLQINNNTYQYNSIDTTVQPNLVASTGATLTMGSTNLALLDEDDIETATNNGWSLV